MTQQQPDPNPHSAGQACQVFAAEDIFVAAGANLDDALAPIDEVELGDIYRLAPRAQPQRLVLIHHSPAEEPEVAAGSAIGRPGERVKTLASYRMMSAEGHSIELLLLGLQDGHYVLPLSPMASSGDYTLLACDPAPQIGLLTDVMAVAFARGTKITLASGRQVAIEHLKPGDPILTRDHGPQLLRFIGHASLRAIGAFAPVVIPAGTMGNSGDLIVSQHHRMFLYQRRRIAGMQTSELLVQARDLVDETHIFIREGGVTDWFSLIFDRHEIIYAEGIPAESLMVNDATTSRLPPEIASEVRARFPELAQVQHFGTELGRNFLEAIKPEHLFQRKAARLSR